MTVNSTLACATERITRVNITSTASTKFKNTKKLLIKSGDGRTCDSSTKAISRKQFFFLLFIRVVFQVNLNNAITLIELHDESTLYALTYFVMREPINRACTRDRCLSYAGYIIIMKTDRPRQNTKLGVFGVGVLQEKT